MMKIHLRSSLPTINISTIPSEKISSSWRLIWTDSTPTRQVRILIIILLSLTSSLPEPGVHHIPLDVHGFPDVPNYSMDSDSDYKIFSKINKKKNKKKKKPLYRPPPVLTEYKPVFSSRQSDEPQYRHQYPEDTTNDYKFEKVGFTDSVPA